MTNYIKIHNQNIKSTNILQGYQKKRTDKDNTNISTPLKPADFDKGNNSLIQNIGLPAIVTTLFLLFSSKSFIKNVDGYTSRLKNYLEYRLNLNMLNEKSGAVKFYNFFINKINMFLRFCQSINNMNSLKDILFMKLMYKTKPTKYIHQKITSIFEDMSRKTITKSYKHTSKDFEIMNKRFDNLDEYLLQNKAEEVVEYQGEKYKIRDLVKKANELRASINFIIGRLISSDGQASRYTYIKDTNSKLYDEFWKMSFKGFWTKRNNFNRQEMWQTFIAEDQMRGDRTTLAEKINTGRNIVTYSKDDKLFAIKKLVENLSHSILPSDVEGLKILEKLMWFVKNPTMIINNKEAFAHELASLRKLPISTMINTQTAEQLKNCRKQNLDLIKNILDDDDTGDIQRMMSIYYKLAPFELDKSGALFATKKAISSLNESIHLEIAEFFDKERDLAIGSAPTDILTMILSLGLITHDMIKAKDKRQKESVMLTSGIPLIGGVATSFVSATKLVSGGKSIALGFVSGFILNRIGKGINDLIQKRELKYAKTKKEVA